MMLLWLLLLFLARVEAQSIGFISSQNTVCFSPTLCNVRVQIAGEVSGAIQNTIKLAFGNGVIVTFSGNSQDVSMNINPTTLLASATSGGATTVIYVMPGATNALSNGNYTLTASYQRTADSSIVTSPPFNWTLWGFTPSPVLVDFGAATNLPLRLQFAWPPNPFLANDSLAGSRQVVIRNETGVVFTLVLNDMDNPVTLPASLADGNYNLTFSYRDNRPHPAASVTASFRLDTVTEPLNVSRITADHAQYYLTEAGTVLIGESEWGTAIVGAPNYYFFTSAEPVTLSFIDLLQNPASTVTVTPAVALNSTIATITETVIRREKEYDQLLLGLVIGLGVAFAVSSFVILGLYKGWCGPYARLKT